MKIKNIADLREEKQRLAELSRWQKTVLEQDVQFIKHEFTGKELLSKAAASIVPASIRKSKWLNAPINFIARKIFRAKEDIVSESSDSGTGNLTRNLALSTLTTVGGLLIGKIFKKK